MASAMGRVAGASEVYHDSVGDEDAARAERLGHVDGDGSGEPPRTQGGSLLVWIGILARTTVTSSGSTDTDLHRSERTIGHQTTPPRSNSKPDGHRPIPEAAGRALRWIVLLVAERWPLYAGGSVCFPNEGSL